MSRVVIYFEVYIDLKIPFNKFKNIDYWIESEYKIERDFDISLKWNIILNFTNIHTYLYNSIYN